MFSENTWSTFHYLYNIQQVLLFDYLFVKYFLPKTIFLEDGMTRFLLKGSILAF